MSYEYGDTNIGNSDYECNDCKHYENEISRLKAEVERLRDACAFAKAQIAKGSPKKALPVLRNVLSGKEGIQNEQFS
jgi:hypothetical protein